MIMNYIIIITILLSFLSDSFSQQRNGKFTYHDNIDFFGYAITKIEKSKTSPNLYAITVDAQNSNDRFSISIFNGTSWTNITSEEYGYPYPDIVELYDMAIGTNDVLWLASSVGVIKYDGNTWETFAPSTPSKFKRVYKHIAIDSSDNIIFNTALLEFMYKSEGTNLYRNVVREIIKIDAGDMNVIYYSDTTDNNNLYGLTLQDLEVSPSGEIWIAYLASGGNGGLARYSSNDEWEVVDLKSRYSDVAAYPTNIFFDEDGKILISLYKVTNKQVRGGITTYDPVNETWDILEDYGEITGDFSESFELAIKDKNGDIWAAGSWGRLSIIKSDETEVILTDALFVENYLNYVNDMVEDEDGVIWFAMGGGLMSYDPLISGIETDDANISKIRLSPNFIQNGENTRLNYSFAKNVEQLDVFIVDMLGGRQVLFSSNNISQGDEYTYEIENLSEFATGKYYIELHVDGKLLKVALIIVN